MKLFYAFAGRCRIEREVAAPALLSLLLGNDGAGKKRNDASRIHESQHCLGIREIAGQKQLGALTAVREAQSGSSRNLRIGKACDIARRDSSQTTGTDMRAVIIGVDGALAARAGRVSPRIHAGVLDKENARIACIVARKPRNHDSRRYNALRERRPRKERARQHERHSGE